MTYGITEIFRGVIMSNQEYKKPILNEKEKKTIRKIYMLNIEKYRNEIMEVYNIISDNNPLRSFGDNFGNALFSVFLSRKSQSKDLTADEDVLNWLISEYKEPILTDEAKNYLRLILEPSKCYSIQKLMNDEDHKVFKLLCGTDSGYIAILYKRGTKYYEYFKYMENDKKYTPEELDL